MLQAHVAVRDLPLVVLLGQHRADEADDRRAVGEDPDDVGSSAHLAVEPLLGVVRPDLPPVVAPEGGEGQELLARLLQQRGGIGEARAQPLHHRGVLGTDDRTYKEYVATRAATLRDDGLERAYLVIVAARFRSGDAQKLADYLAGSDVRGITLLGAEALMRIVEGSIRDRSSFTLAHFERTLFGTKLIDA